MTKPGVMVQILLFLPVIYLFFSYSLYPILFCVRFRGAAQRLDTLYFTKCPRRLQGPPATAISISCAAFTSPGLFCDRQSCTSPPPLRLRPSVCPPVCEFVCFILCVSTRVKSFGVCLSLSDLFHSAQCPLGPSMLSQMVGFCYFVWLSNRPWGVRTRAVHPLVRRPLPCLGQGKLHCGVLTPSD